MKIAVLGAGPVGIEFAIHCLARVFYIIVEPFLPHRNFSNFCPFRRKKCSDATVVIFEGGPSVAANVAKWDHIRLFSPWSINVSKGSQTVVDP